MKKILLNTTFFLIALTGFSQSFTNLSYNSATSDAFDGISGDCNIGIKISTTQNGVFIEHYLQSFDLKTLRIAYKDIPASQVPSYVILDKSVDVTFDLYVNNVFIERYGQPSVSWARLQGLSNSDGYKPSTKENGYKLFNSGAISIKNVKIKKLTYRVEEKYNTKIRTELAGVNNKNTTANPVKQGNSTSLTIENGSSNNNPVTQTNTPTKTSGNDPLAHINNPSPEKSSFQKGYENGKIISDALTPIIDQWAANNQKKWAEKKEKIEKEIATSRQASFEKYYAKTYNFDIFFKNNIEAANKGDELTQMKLISAASKLYRHKNEIGYSKLPSILPKMDEWLISAFKNNNLDAMNWIGESFLNTDTATAIKILENAASFGSLDAMIQLGLFYGANNAKDYYGNKLPIRGDNWEKSLHWFTKAADNGCPMGMYFLGMIYKYKSLTWDYQKGKDLKYDVKIDKEKAYSYFLKSIKLKDFPTTLFADSYEKEDYNVTVSRFNGKAYLELNHKSRQERWDNEEIYKKWKAND